MKPLSFRNLWLKLLVLVVVAMGLELALAQQIEVLETTDSYRLVRHAAGETQVPLEPTRIAVLGSGYIDHLITLGLPPIGIPLAGNTLFPDYLAEHLQDAQSIGSIFEPNLEALLVAQPDLIIGMAPLHNDLYNNMSAIAPTVLINEPWRDWRSTLTQIGDILGRRAEADAALEGFSIKLAKAKEQLAAIQGEKAAFMRVLPKEIRFYGVSSPTGDILFNGLGLTPASLVPLEEEALPVSLEKLPELDAEHLFLLDQTEDAMATIHDSGLWQTIPAVQEGNLYPVSAEVWIQGGGVQAYRLIIDQAVAALLGRNE